MPIDPSISLGIHVPQLQNPLETISTIAQIQGLREQTEARRLAGEEARRKAADQAAIRQVLTESGGDIEQALPRLRQIAPQAALEFETEIHKARKEKFDAATHQITARTKGLEFAATMAALVAANPARASAVRGHLQGLSEEIRPLLPESDDPADWQAFSDLALTAKERYDKGQANLKLFGEGKLQEALGGGLSLARNAEEWNVNLQTFRELGGPKAIADLFGEYSPANVARAAQLALMPDQRQGSYQSKPVLLDGKPALVGFNPHTNTYHRQGEDVTARVQDVPPQSVDPLLHTLRQLQVNAAVQAAQSGGNWTPKQIATFNQIASAYDRSPLIKAADRTIVLKDAIKAVKADPRSATNQLNLAYAYIAGLDTYQSAVREGELKNLGVLGTRLQQLGVTVDRYVSSGAFIPPGVAAQIATSAEQLVSTIEAGQKQKQREFGSRAKVSGVGPMWDQFVAGFEAPPDTAAAAGGPAPVPANVAAALAQAPVGRHTLSNGAGTWDKRADGSIVKVQ